MASIVKRPVNGSKGILVITDGEWRDWLKVSPTLQHAIQTLKSRWLVLVHGNSAIQQRYGNDNLIDAFIAGPGDIIWTAPNPPYQIEMDCSNFCPKYFEQDSAGITPFWDLLFISRNQKFKSVDDLFPILRKVFDHAPVRVLAIISETSAEAGINSEPVRRYTSMFTKEERKYFTLLSPWIDYPFSLDLPTLAHFYRHSRAFLHTATQERHPRVAGYAWATGIPVIAPQNVSSLLPPELADAPGFFPFSSPDEAPALIQRVLANAGPLPKEYRQFHLATFQIERFKDELKKLYARLEEPFVDGGWFLADLDVRLARHHDRMAGTNTSKASLFQLAKALNETLPAELGDDPEAGIDQLCPLPPDDPAVERERNDAARRQGHIALREACRNGDLRQATKLGVMTLARMAGLLR